jgi:phage-related protein
MIREIIFYDNHFTDFYSSLPQKVQGKIDSILVLIASIRMIPEKFLKHISGTDGLFEIRIEYAGNAYRIFCIFDKGNIVILLNCFQKKTRKTPESEIEKALALQKKYNQNKNIR